MFGQSKEKSSEPVSKAKPSHNWPVDISFTPIPTDKSKEQNFSKDRDPFIRLTAYIQPRPGMSVVDEANRACSARQIPLGFERTDSCPLKWATLPRDTGQLLAKNACCALDAGGFVRHAWSDDDRLKKFAGFVDQNLDGNKVLVIVAGAAFLRVAERTNQIEPRAHVYALGPNKFSLEKEKGAIFIGEVRFAQPDRQGIASVKFDSGLSLKNYR